MTFASDHKDRLREIRAEVKRLRRLIEARDRRIETIEVEQRLLRNKMHILKLEGQHLGGGYF